MTLFQNDVLRHSIIKKRALLTLDEIAFFSKKIIEKIKATSEYKRSQTIAMYYPFRGEVSLLSLWEDACNEGKTCFFPVTDGEKMHFLPATPDTQFLPSRLGVLEPKVERSMAVALHSLDIVLMPLVAFDLFGMRLGMGKGFYDKAFELSNRHAQPILLGVAYEFQKEAFLEKQPWDVLLAATVTENKIYWTP